MVFDRQSSLFVDWNNGGGNTKLVPGVIHTYIYICYPPPRGPTFQEVHA